MKVPKIEIKGSAGSGKTTLARIIKAALEAHGIKCEVTGHEDETSQQIEACWQDRIKSFSDKTVAVAIETIQLRRNELKNCKELPICPNCGNNRQVWVNQITNKFTCHRTWCHLELE